MAELEESRKRQGTPMPPSASVTIGSLQPSRGSSTAVSPSGSGFMPLSARSSRKGSPGFGSDWFAEDSSSEDGAFKEFTAKLDSLRSELEEAHGLQLADIKEALRREHEAD